MKRRTNLVAMIFGFLTGCAYNSGVVDMGVQTHFISKQARTGFSGMGKLRAQVLGEAGKFCAAQDKELEVLKIEEPPGPYILGNFPRVDLTFSCGYLAEMTE